MENSKEVAARIHKEQNHTYVNVTANGSPSGTTTTTIVTAVVTILMTPFTALLTPVFQL